MAPRLTEVFLIRETSMHAWKNLGFSPEVKEAAESKFGPFAYEIMICMLPWFPETGKWELSKRSAEVFNTWIGFPGIGGAASKVAQEVQDPKFRAELRKVAGEVLKKIRAGEEKRAEEIIGDLRAKRAVAPESYGKGKVLDLGDGWAWYMVGEGECAGHEGTLMQHCGQAVGTMYSLRDPQGKPHVTLDYLSEPEGVDSGPLHYDPGVAQLRGKQNREPDRKYWPMIKKFIQKLPKQHRVITDPESSEELQRSVAPQEPESDTDRFRRMGFIEDEPEPGA